MRLEVLIPCVVGGLLLVVLVLFAVKKRVWLARQVFGRPQSTVAARVEMQIGDPFGSVARKKADGSQEKLHRVAKVGVEKWQNISLEDRGQKDEPVKQDGASC